MKEMKYRLMNLLVVYEAGEPVEVPFDKPFGSL
jgi:hypothetical protein